MCFKSNILKSFELFVKINKTFNLNKMSTKRRHKSEITSKYFDNKVTNDSKQESTEELSSQSTIETKKRRNNKPIIESNESTKEPKNWQKLYENIVEMRSSKSAVVDSMGAERTADENEVNPKNKRFQTLVSLMLSSQTRDEITYRTMQSLIKYGLTVEHIIETSDERLKELIKSVSFYNNKTKFIKKTAQILKDKYDSDIPNNVSALLSLPGVGPKMAHLAMQIAWNECTGIAVDTHVHRICNRLEWTQSKTPEQTQQQIEKWFPKHLWNEMNLLLVGFGQTICSPIKPKCGQCLNEKLCPFALKNNSESGVDF